MGCLADQEIADFVAGRTPAAGMQLVDSHIADCPTCFELVACNVKAQQVDHPVTSPSIGPGDSVGRYVVLDVAGRGAMGVVYAAYDPKLDRRVALKIVAGHSGGSSDSTKRVFREAQALAKLNHTNVIGVYDVGNVGNGVFIAMEFVSGNTLGQWIEQESPSEPDILRVFADAGRGLQAAHEAGLVHRDFKPDNVLIDRNGRAIVTDFGLVRAVGTHQVADSVLPSAVGLDLTHTGAIVGTPAYMSPEQHTGRTLDARSDQFCFCVTLYEALTGRRPFEGASLTQLRDAVLEGRVEEAPALPPEIRAVLTRGLSVDPDSRYPSMGELLSDLTPPATSSRRMWFGLAAAMVLLAALVMYTRAGATGVVDHCPLATGEVAQVWNADAKAHVRSTLTSMSHSAEADAAARVVRTIDRYVASWLESHHDTCTATHERNTQSEHLLDVRMACLSDRLRSVQAYVQALAQADDQAFDKAIRAAHKLPDVRECAHTRDLLDGAEAPLSDEQRAALSDARAQLRLAKSQLDLGQYATGRATANASIERAQALGDRRLQAQGLLLLGRMQQSDDAPREAEKTLGRAIEHAVAVADKVLMARIWITLSNVVGTRLEQHDRGLVYNRLAASAIASLGGRARLEGERLVPLGTILQLQGRYAEAAVTTKQAMDTLTEELGTDHPHVAVALMLMGNIALRRSQHSDAVTYFERCHEILEMQYGPTHPHVGVAQARVGEALRNQGKLSEADDRLQTAYDVLMAARGSKNRHRLGSTLTSWGGVRTAMGDVAGALSKYEQSLAIYSELFGDDHPQTGISRLNLAEFLRQQGKFERARELNETTLEHYVARLGEDHIKVSWVNNNLAVVLNDLGHYREAQKRALRALRIRERIHGPNSTRLCSSLLTLAASYRLAGSPQEALPHVRRAVTIVENAESGTRLRLAVFMQAGEAAAKAGKRTEAAQYYKRCAADPSTEFPAEIAECHFQFARSLPRTQRSQAIQSAKRARDILTDAKRTETSVFRRVSSWLARR